MIFIKRIFLLVLTLSLLLVGCSIEASHTKITSIDGVDINLLKDLGGTFVGDHNKVIKVIGCLPGGESFKEIDLSGEKVKVTYGYDGGSPSEKEITDFWFDGSDGMRKNFYFNAAYLAILVPNAKEYHFIVGSSKLSLKRDQLVKTLSKHLVGFPDEKAIWKKDTIAKLINDNHVKIKEIAVNHKQYFE